MIEKDFDDFQQAWVNACEASIGAKMPSENAVNHVFELLADYSLDSIQAGLKIHSKNSRYAPTPAEIIALVDVGNQRLSADEAWALCPASEDETVVWTEEMADAFTFAAPLLVDGDKIAARMAFKAAYKRLLGVALASGIPVRWKASVGHDRAQTEDAVKMAVEKGWLTRQQARRYIPAPLDGGVIGGLLGGKVVDIHSEKNAKRRANLQKIKQQLVDIGERQRENEQRSQTAVVKQQQDVEARKRQMLAECVSREQEIESQSGS